MRLYPMLNEDIAIIAVQRLRLYYAVLYVQESVIYVRKIMDYNMMLSCTRRTELIGGNMSTVTVNEFTRERKDMWQPPAPGMRGIFCCGHETDVSDALAIELWENGKKLEMEPVRHNWTPAWSETHYRCTADAEYYANSGCIALREKKCITPENVFVSELTVINDKNCCADIELHIVTPFEKADGAYKVDAAIVPGALNDSYRLKGCFALAGVDEVMALRLDRRSRRRVKFCFAYAADTHAVRSAALDELEEADSTGRNAKRLNEWFETCVPKLSCGDAELEKAYLYRCLLVNINTFSPREVIPEHYAAGQAMYESRYGSWFGATIGLPLPLQVCEARWLDTELAAGQLELLRDKEHVTRYINNAARAAMELWRVTGDTEWLSGIYEFFRDMTLEKCSKPGELPVTTGSWVVGAEHQPSYYQHREPAWDWRHDSSGLKMGFDIAKLYRLDEISFYAQNLNACAEMAGILGRRDEEKELAALRDEAKRRLEKEFWNERDGIFYDIDYETGMQCDLAACYDSFAPYMDGIVDSEKHSAAFDKLFDEAWFGDEFSVPSAARNCPMFWFDNCITGPAAASLTEPHEYGACWNGPIWPFAVSMVLHGLGSYAVKHREYRDKWLELFRRFTKLHFLDGDMSTPCITEHYHPGDGRSFSSAVDYFHSGYVDFIMKYWAGIRPGIDGPVFAPFTDDEFEISGVRMCGKTYCFRQYKKNGRLMREYAAE